MRSWRNARKRPFRPPVFAPLLIWPDAFRQAAARKAGGGERAEERRLVLISAGRPFALRQESVQSLAARGERGEGGGIRLQGDNRKWALRLARHWQRPRAPKIAQGRAVCTRRQIADRRSGGGSPAGAASETGANTKGGEKAFAPVPPGHDAMDSGARNNRFRWACARPARTVLLGAGLRTGAQKPSHSPARPWGRPSRSSARATLWSTISSMLAGRW